MDDQLFSSTPLDQEGPPEIVEIEPIHTCNLRCTMCHVSYTRMTKQRLDPSFVDRLAGLDGKWAKIGSQYEPVAHPQFDHIVNAVTQRGMKIDLTTNGTLFTDELIRQIEQANFRNVTISFDGATAATYEAIRRRGHFKEAIKRILAFKDMVKSRNPDAYFNVNFTFMMSNVAEVDDAAEMWNSFGFDHIGYISMTIPVGRSARRALADESPDRDISLMRSKMTDVANRIVGGNQQITASSPWFRDPAIVSAFPRNAGIFGLGLVGSDNSEKRWPINPIPYFQDGYFPGVPVACRSPYKLARVDYDGTVRLCNTFPVGSIYDADLLEIWSGTAARALRRRIAASKRVCHACNYYQFCIKANEVDYSDKKVFYNRREPSLIKRLIVAIPVVGPAAQLIKKKLASTWNDIVIGGDHP
jgi:radical SAM protein with 4Fe4S-binding SPASM domain